MQRRKISPDRLIEAVIEYVEGKGSFDTKAEKYRISYETIRMAYIRYKENGITTLLESKHNASYTIELRTNAVYYGFKFTNKSDLVSMIDSYIAYYNTERLQRNLGILTPMEKHAQFYAA